MLANTARSAALLIIFFLIIRFQAYTQCPTAGSTLYIDQSISANCTVTGNLTLQGATLTLDSGVTFTVTGTLTLQGDATISGSRNTAVNVQVLHDRWGNGNELNGGVYAIGTLISDGGGQFYITGATVNTDTAYTTGGSNLVVRGGSGIKVASGMRNSERLTIDASKMDIGGVLDATGGDIITVSNGGELIVRGDYKMNNGGGVQLNLSGGGIVRVLGDVESTTGGNAINVDGTSGISVEGSFIGNMPPDVIVENDDDGTSCFSEGCCGSAVACSDAEILPVSLLGFYGVVKSGFILLQWSTSSELNNDFFTIERSYNGIDFLELATVRGSGTTNQEINYTYNDPANFDITDQVYYRLSQTDFDGTYEILDVIAVSSLRSRPNVTIFPNPVKQGESIKMKGWSQQFEWALSTSDGRLIKTELLMQNGALDTSPLSSGTYFMRVYSGAKPEIRAIVIQ